MADAIHLHDVEAVELVGRGGVAVWLLTNGPLKGAILLSVDDGSGDPPDRSVIGVAARSWLESVLENPSMDATVRDRVDRLLAYPDALIDA